MEYSEGRDFMFCGLCGTMRTLSSTKHAQCPLCKQISRRQISYIATAEDVRRELGISIIREEKVQLQKTDAKTCEKCGHNEHTYYSRQMRSADEGATTFYVCTNCQHQFTEN
ncbi:DNA-directed RNA polymerase I subunit RPA12 [Prunus yedoensis var. nudiflora]|uniref:DNA-directed RNA polymerase subunit n=1 Tax=Prunus yedoensis var. nudiflora TaxID=2094558 RepID=A0A314ZGN7_PRUYE|nr:DNA-directed RNA polymerase I subunit RPA12 [Prunus yedoensis var. nudiflora]